MSGETYPYLSDAITADSLLHPLPSPLDSRVTEEGDYLFNWMDALQPYGLESDLSRESPFYPNQDFSTDFSFCSESELLWQQFEDPVSFGPELEQQPFNFPEYPLHTYQQETQPSSYIDTTTTPSSQNSSSEQSPVNSYDSQGETARENTGVKRRNNVHSSEDTHIVDRKRIRPRNQLDHGYESMSPEANISSPPYVSTYESNFIAINAFN